MTRVFDSSAVLAAIFQEPGGDSAVALWAEGENLISAVNYAEVVAKLNERGVSDFEVSTVMEGVPLTPVDFDQTTAHASGLLRSGTKSLGLSLGDRACLALALGRGAVAVTADKQWEKFTGVTLFVIR
jgi:ribonuclease VapC